MDSAQRAERRRVFLSGVRDGVPIGLGYLAVAFSLGIAARNVGLNAFQGFLISLLNNASAVLAAHPREFPYVSAADGAACRQQDEAQPGTQAFSFHLTLSFRFSF